MPQIEVSFDVDENGILLVGAEDKATDNKESITITNDKSRLTEEEINRMVKEAEDFEEEDKKVKQRVEAKNQLESTAYSLKNQIHDDDKLGDKLDEDDKNAIEEAVKEALDWLDENPSAEKEEYDEALQKLQGVSNPIISKVYQAGGGGEGGEEADEEESDL